MCSGSCARFASPLFLPYTQRMSSIGAAGDGFQKGFFQVISPGVSQVVAIGAASVQANGFSDGVTVIRLFANVDCWLAFGSNPTAAAEAAGSMLLPAGVVEYFERKEGEKIAVIQSSSTGKLYITEGSTS